MTTPSQDRAAWLEERAIPTAESCLNEHGNAPIHKIADALREQDSYHAHPDLREMRIVCRVLVEAGWKGGVSRVGGENPCWGYRKPEVRDANS